MKKGIINFKGCLMKRIALFAIFGLAIAVGAFAEEETDDGFKTTIERRWVINERFRNNLTDLVMKMGASTDLSTAITNIANELCPGKTKEDLTQCLSIQLSTKGHGDGSWVDPGYLMKRGGLEGIEDPNQLLIDPWDEEGNTTLFEQILVEGKGEPYTVLNDLGAFPSREATKDPLSFFNLGHWTDCQLIDEVSPARLTVYDNVVSSSHEPGEDTFIFACSALIEELNKFMDETGRAIDILVHTGDYIDTGEAIELRWSNALTHGGKITPCTGLEDPDTDLEDPLNPTTCLDRDAWMKKELSKFLWTEGSDKPFYAPGLDPNVPHYYVYGNHDGLVTGNFPNSDDVDHPEGHDPEAKGNRLLGHHIGSFVTEPDACATSAYGLTYNEVIANGINYTGFDPVDLTLGNILQFFGALLQCAKTTDPEFDLADIELPQFDLTTDGTKVLQSIENLIDIAIAHKEIDLFDESRVDIGLKKVDVGKDTRRELIGSKNSSSFATYDLDQRQKTIEILWDEAGETAEGFKHSLAYYIDTQQPVLDENGEPIHCNESIAHGEVENQACAGFYAFDCLEDNFINDDPIPLRCIAMDSLGNGSSISEGAATAPMGEFLREELEKAQEERKLVIVFSHHGPESFLTNNLTSLFGFKKSDYPEEGCRGDGCALVHLFNQHENMVAWVYGHGHKNLITPWPSPDPERPELGFWSIQTAAAGINWPQVARTCEFIDFRNGIGGIACTMIEHNEDPEDRPDYSSGDPFFIGDDKDVEEWDQEILTRRGRQLAYHSLRLAAWDALMGEHTGFIYDKATATTSRDVQIGTVTDSSRTRISQEGEAKDRNVVLLFQLSPEMADTLASITNDKPLTFLELDPEVEGKITAAFEAATAPEPAPGNEGGEDDSPKEAGGGSSDGGCGCRLVGDSRETFGVGSIATILLAFVPWLWLRRRVTIALRPQQE